MPWSAHLLHSIHTCAGPGAPRAPVAVTWGPPLGSSRARRLRLRTAMWDLWGQLRLISKVPLVRKSCAMNSPRSPGLSTYRLDPVSSPIYRPDVALPHISHITVCRGPKSPESPPSRNQRESREHHRLNSSHIDVRTMVEHQVDRERLPKLAGASTGEVNHQSATYFSSSLLRCRGSSMLRGRS